jgi:glycosyltransferase involved in cell wall biosynthesis
MVASDWLAADLVAAGVPGNRLRVVPPGKDPDIPAGDPTGQDSMGGLDRAGLRRGRLMAAACIANWLPRKGIVELLEAIAGLPDDVVTLHLVGDTATRGGYARRVHERLEHADLRDRVVVHGLIAPAAVQRMYEAVDAFVLPSFEEPYGTVWGEAMAEGLPVVGWRAGNLPFLADHGRDGVLLPVGDVAALGGAIEWLARDPAARERLGRAARVRAAARPTWDETAARFFAIIRDVLSQQRERLPRHEPGP